MIPIMTQAHPQSHQYPPAKPVRRICIDNPTPRTIMPSQITTRNGDPLRIASGSKQLVGQSTDQTGTRVASQHSPPRDLDGSVASAPLSSVSSLLTRETNATSMLLTPLQTRGVSDELDELEPLELEWDDPQSFDLVQPPTDGKKSIFSLETRSNLLFSREHLVVIFSDPKLLVPFTGFLSNYRPQSVPVLVYYLDALKALKAIAYANAVHEALKPINGHEFTSQPAESTRNPTLEAKASKAFETLVNEDLPAYITYMYIKTVSISVTRRITGTLAPHLREASEGLAEVFCLTDPARRDNPIIFASEEFHRTTQYGMNYAIGRNCRFLQGPQTSPSSIRRLRDAVAAEKEHCEVFLNYRRDGSSFMNMLMIAPLRDSRGKIRYFIGAQVDVSGLVKDCTDMESLQRLVVERAIDAQCDGPTDQTKAAPKDDFKELSEMFNTMELETVRRSGGRMHREQVDDDENCCLSNGMHKPRLLLKDPGQGYATAKAVDSRAGGFLSGVFQHYLLIRPFPILRILFASPSLRVPGILQSPFMDKIGGSSRVREELTAALAEGRGVTAKVRWVTKFDEEGRNRWIHCTPLLGSNGHIGVWMVVIVDEEPSLSRRWKQAPPVPVCYTNSSNASLKHHREYGEDTGDFDLTDGSIRTSSPFGR